MELREINESPLSVATPLPIKIGVQNPDLEAKAKRVFSLCLRTIPLKIPEFSYILDAFIQEKELPFQVHFQNTQECNSFYSFLEAKITLDSSFLEKPEIEDPNSKFFSFFMM